MESLLLNRIPVKVRRPSDAYSAILKAAERIFAESGLAGARTDEIAKAAGVNKALLYYYFKSKDGLYQAVLERYLGEFRSRAFEVFSSHQAVSARILQYIDLHFEFIVARPYYPSLIQRLMTARSDPCRKLMDENRSLLYRKLTALIQEGVENGELRPVDPHHAFFSLVFLIVSYFAAAPIVKSVSHIDPFDPANIKKRKEEVLSLIRGWLIKDGESSLHDAQNPDIDINPGGGRKRRRLLADHEPQRGPGADRNREHGRGHR